MPRSSSSSSTQPWTSPIAKIAIVRTVAESWMPRSAFHVSAGVGEHAEKGVVECSVSVRGDDPTGAHVVRPAAEIGDPPAGCADDGSAGGHVVGPDLPLPVA